MHDSELVEMHDGELVEMNDEFVWLANQTNELSD